MRRGIGLLLLIMTCGSLAAADPQHFVFFNLDRERIRETSFLESEALVGAQLKYTWRELEPTRGDYDLAPILADLAFLKRHGKRLFVQLQDVSFRVDVPNVPPYLIEDPAYGGGAHLAYSEEEDPSHAKPESWVPRRWDPEVRQRFSELLEALGRELDGKIEGLNLAETSIGFGAPQFYPDDFDNDLYLEGVLEIMSAARDAFKRSHVIQYANFMPGEWLPWDDNGYLKRVYAHAEENGIGVGGPDLLPFRRGQLNHSYPLIEARDDKIVAGLAVQWGNFDDLDPESGKRSSVEDLYAFGSKVLKLDYIFWGTEEPHYSEEVVPFLQRNTVRRN